MGNVPDQFAEAAMEELDIAGVQPGSGSADGVGGVVADVAAFANGGGLQLVPAISVARNGWGALILAAYDIGPELVRLIRADIE